MGSKYKMTGCARFMIFLVILIPIAFFGSKYLRDSGTWDKIKEKVETKDTNAVEDAIQKKMDRSDVPRSTPSNDHQKADDYDQLKEAYQEQEDALAKREQDIKDLQTENEALKRRANESDNRASIPSSKTNTEANLPSSNPPTRTQSSNESPSMDDLLREADLSPSDNNNSGGVLGGAIGGARTHLGKWSFSFSGTTGEIEFYRQNGKLMSSTTSRSLNGEDIDELVRSGDRFTVRNSPDGEYYILLSNGDLEAYARSGFQTTCRRMN